MSYLTAAELETLAVGYPWPAETVQAALITGITAGVDLLTITSALDKLAGSLYDEEVDPVLYIKAVSIAYSDPDTRKDVTA